MSTDRGIFSSKFATKSHSSLTLKLSHQSQQIISAEKRRRKESEISVLY